MHKIEYCTFYLINSFIGGRRIILLCENPSGSLLMLLHKCIEPIIDLFQVCGYGKMQKASFMDITFQVCRKPLCVEFLGYIAEVRGLSMLLLL
jgi:hypothetical protein